MSYIQNKLDDLRKLTIELRREHFTIDTGGDGIVEVLPNLEKQAKYNDGIEKWIEQALTESYNQGKTDYHNHIMKYLKANHIDYCIQQNGMPYCKNCGLDLTEMEHDLSLLQDTNPKEL